MVWIIIEVNLIIFIPFICNKKYLIEISPSIKYFLAQVLGSLLLILFIYLNILKRSSNNVSEFNSLFLLTAIAVKSGTPPFHFWFPQLVEIRNWIQITALLTLQKIIPIVFLFYSLNFLFIVILVLRGLVGALGGFNQNSLKKIIAYSSITHIGWIILSLEYSIKISLVYFFRYSFIILLFILLIKNSSIHLNSVNLLNYNILHKSLICISIFSISGLPPFLGFIIKLMVILYSIKNIFLVLLIVIFSFISMVYYTRILYFYIIKRRILPKIKIITMVLEYKVTASYVLFIRLIFPLFIIFII